MSDTSGTAKATRDGVISALKELISHYEESHRSRIASVQEWRHTIAVRGIDDRFPNLQEALLEVITRTDRLAEEDLCSIRFYKGLLADITGKGSSLSADVDGVGPF